MLTTKKKAAIVKNAARHDTDTGSPDVQVALLSKQIDELAKHLKKNPKDFHSRRGLLQMVADRRLQPLAPSAPDRHTRIDDWDELRAAIEAAIA